MKTLFRKIMGSSFLVGMASVFCPSVIEIEPVEFDDKSDAQNIAGDWEQIGRDITKVYNTLSTKSNG